jgi:hypothetical protein
MKANVAGAALLVIGVVGCNLEDQPTNLKAGRDLPATARSKVADRENRLGVSFARETQRFGFVCRMLKDPRYPEKRKLLTRDERGLTNNTIVRIDGFDYVFGREIPGARFYRDKGGKLWREVQTDERRWVSVMHFERERVHVTQSVEIVVGEQTDLYDTALIKYTIENQDRDERTVGLRVMLDTMIGVNDGVPFEIGPSPAEPKPATVTKMAVLEGGKIPEYIRAIENMDRLGAADNTVAEMGLKLKGLEPIRKLVICRWPQWNGGSEARWEWPYLPMDLPAGAEPDSCVVVYWSTSKMAPQQKRACGFSYGLGRIANGETEGEGRSATLRLFARPAKVSRPFVVTAYIRGAAGRKVRIDLPPELSLVAGQKVEQEAREVPGKGYAQVSWVVRSETSGTFRVKAQLEGSRGVEEAITVRQTSIFD